MDTRGPPDSIAMPPSSHYPIRAVARMTGLSPDTLRAWERRYQVVTPRRDDRGRVYEDRDVERLKRLARLVDHGHAIGTIAGLSTAALDRLIENAAPESRGRMLDAVDLAPLVRAIKQYDLAAVETVLSRHAVLLPPDGLIFAVVLPLLREAGARWEAGTIRPSQEHLVSAIVRSILGGLLRTMPRPAEGKPLVFATLPGERHELGLLCGAVLAAHNSYAVTYLGPDLPAADLVHAVTARHASTLVISATMSESASVGEIRLLRRLDPEVALWLGGAGCAPLRHELGARARVIETLEQFAGLVERRAR